MYPPDRDAALAEQLETEHVLSELVSVALSYWLPAAGRAVAGGTVPNPAAAGDTDAQWDYLIDGMVLHAIGVLAAHEYERAYTALNGAPPEPALTAAGLGPLRFDMPGMPTLKTLREKANAALSRLGIDAEAVEARAAALPQLRQFAADYVASARDRVMDAARRLFRRTTEAVSEEEPLTPVFDPLDPEWMAAADQVGTTHATAVLNAATQEAARDVAKLRPLEMEWVAILDEVTREAHERADGQRQPIDVPFSVGGESLRFPGDPRGSIENTINCRCRVFAFFVGEARIVAAAPGIDTMTSDTEERPVGEYRSFTSVLAVIGEKTDDGRMFADNIDLTFRDFPLPLMWCKQSSGGHYDAYTVGVIEDAKIEGSLVTGSGYFLNTEEALEAVEQAEHGVTGPSVDLGSTEWELRDGDGNTITDEEWWDDPDMEVISTVLAAKVLAATLVSTPAFGQTSITLGEMVERGEAEAVVASLTAAAAAPGPVSVKAFMDPQFDRPTYPHMTDEGFVRGHLAAWNVCHVGIQDRCVLAPKSRTEYGWFHTSPPVQTTDGPVAVGRLTVGGGHAGAKLGVGATIAHYDDVGTCFALVHVGEDEHGIWFSGIPSPGATPEQIAKGLAAPLSGDWRSVGGNLELVAALSVNTPGFPLVASGATNEEGEALSLIASLGPCAEDSPEGSGALSEAQLRVFAQIILEERDASERRKAAALSLFEEERRREAAALIAEGSV